MKDLVDGIVDHHQRGMSPGDCFFLFVDVLPLLSRQ